MTEKIFTITYDETYRYQANIRATTPEQAWELFQDISHYLGKTAVGPSTVAKVSVEEVPNE